MTITITPDQTREYMLGQCGLRAYREVSPELTVKTLLEELRCIQLDPLDTIGANAELVVLARLNGLKREDIFQQLYPGHAFEHFAKERCLLPPSAFPYYRERSIEQPWWRLGGAKKRLTPDIIEAVLDEIRESGPVTVHSLQGRGNVKSIDWSGWKGTGRASTMALDVLSMQCKVVVCGRSGKDKHYDIPERALPEVHDLDTQENFAKWAIVERVEAAGLLSRAGGPWWSMLREARTSGVVEELIEEGKLVQVCVEGSRRVYLAPPDFLDRTFPEDDEQVKILGPLDPLIWDRKLTEHIFDFNYVWEVYKPAEKRLWGWYVCPILYKGQLIARFEGRVQDGEIVVDNLWKEKGKRFPKKRWQEALERHARCLIGE